ncbi:MAG: hypothetical protein WA005_00160 [Candidatus Binataceae bacterium]
MTVTVKKITMWRGEVDDRPGVLASTLEPLAQAKADLKMVMGYRLPSHEGRAAIGVHPVVGKKAADAARGAGLAASAIPTLLVEGDNRPGLGHAIAKAIADANINLSFVVAQVVGRRYSAVLAFENQSDAARAAALVRKAGAAKPR